MTLLTVAAGGVVGPAVATGHSSEAENHLLAVSSLGLHVLVASLWVGGLLALVLHGSRGGVLATAARRFSVLALVCFVATGVTGALSAWVVASPLTGVLGTGYGMLLFLKTLALAGLGVLGWAHRRTLPALAAGRPGAFRRFAAVEVAAMLATIALAVALAASPPPASATPAEGAAASTAGTPTPAADPMAGHDHGELSVGVLIDEERYHVPRPVEAGSRVTVFNGSDSEVTLTRGRRHVRRRRPTGQPADVRGARGAG
jgi:hypothetical protein